MTATLLLSLAMLAADGRQHLDAAEAALEAGNTAAVIESVERALDADPDDVQAREIAARLAVEDGRAGDAIAHLEHLLGLDPANDEARLLLARAQWLSGSQANARQTLKAVLARHPELEAGVALEADMKRPPEAASPWQPAARFGLSVGFDSNLSLDPGTLPDVSNREAGLLDIDLAASLTHANAAFPVTAFGRVTSQVALVKQEELHDLTPSTVGLGIVGQRPVGAFTAAVDIRYEELFTNGFSEHRQRLVAPGLWGQYRIGEVNTIQVALGAEVRQPSETFAPSDSISGKLSVRDVLALDALEILADLGLRRNRSFGDEVAPTAGTASNVRTDFDEVGGLVTARYAITEAIGAHLLLAVARRSFAADVNETTVHGSLGSAYATGALELYAEYAYSRNDSDEALYSYDRHRLLAGVRAYYE